MATIDLTRVPEPRRFREFPEHAALRARLDELELRLQAADRRREALAGARDADARAGARAMLDAERLPDRPGDWRDPAGADAELARLDADRQAAREAIRLGGQELRLLERRLAGACVEPALAWHRALAAEMARLLVGAAVLARAEEGLTGAMEGAGIPAAGLMPHGGFARPGFLDTRTRPGEEGNLCLWLKDLVEQRVLTGREPWLADFLASEPPAPPRPGPAAGNFAQRAKAKLRRLAGAEG